MAIHLLKHDVCASYFIYENEKGRTKGNKTHGTARHSTYCMLLMVCCSTNRVLFFANTTTLSVSHCYHREVSTHFQSIILLMWWQHSTLSFMYLLQRSHGPLSVCYRSHWRHRIHCQPHNVPTERQRRPVSLTLLSRNA
jgi:hypothetical protein